METLLDAAPQGQLVAIPELDDQQVEQAWAGLVEQLRDAHIDPEEAGAMGVGIPKQRATSDANLRSD